LKQKNIKILRGLILVIVLLTFAFIIWKLFPIFKSLVTEEGRNSFSTQIANLTWKGPLIIIGMSICKVLVVFLPGEPIELLAGMCYGPFWGMIILYIGYLISSFLIIAAVKKFGIELVNDIVPKEKLEKVQAMIDANPKRIEITVFVLYFLPVLPKDLITYIGSLLPISKKKFLFISLFARFPAILSSTIVGSRILSGDILTIVIVYGITYLISAIIAFIYNKFFAKEKRENRKLKRKAASK
jgi:uncharacterized membrane protein YdjX (TVP38/TMEM64 family)